MRRRVTIYLSDDQTIAFDKGIDADYGVLDWGVQVEYGQADIEGWRMHLIPWTSIVELTSELVRA